MDSSIKLIEPKEIFHFGISPSMVKLWLLCRRRWYNHYIRGLKAEGGGYAQFGIALHEVLRLHYEPGVEYSETKLLEVFKKHFTEEDTFEARSQEQGLALVKGYLKRYPVSSEPFEVVSVETGGKDGTTQVQLDGLYVPLNIKVDMHVVDKYTKGHYVVDHKSSSRLGTTFFNKFKNDYQVYCYIAGMSKHLGVPIEGLIINAIGTKKKIDNDSFLRYSFEMSKDQIDYHMEKFKRVANEMLQFVHKNWQDVEQFNPTEADFACTAYNVKCPYLDMCQYNDNINFAKEIKLRNETNR